MAYMTKATRNRVSALERNNESLKAMYLAQQERADLVAAQFKAFAEEVERKNLDKHLADLQSLQQVTEEMYLKAKAESDVWRSRFQALQVTESRIDKELNIYMKRVDMLEGALCFASPDKAIEACQVIHERVEE